ncbi:uncharacterized protein LOC129773710 [Toxorhynchites rutilus septentrionalis]|uniref:uncharacterized protein LOC129773710 n=1 Tax=Toxorhynchites rutilus septentrionalis TaxID=329112 RepID=UPI00247A7FEB|nr:uncharacterized protein LOC129773710 [Toxorhynchites rutilus septentrionalis]
MLAQTAQNYRSMEILQSAEAQHQLDCRAWRGETCVALLYWLANDNKYDLIVTNRSTLPRREYVRLRKGILFSCCWEDLYWNCIEERFCYDEAIANYDPAEDEYVPQTKTGNGFYNSDESLENNNAPICRQPASITRSTNFSSKIHEDDLRREIQTNVPMLAPEVMAVFANSQIFQEHSPSKSSTKNPPAVKFAFSLELPSDEAISPRSEDKTDTATSDAKRKEDSDRLLKRLEGSQQDIQLSRFGTTTIPAIVEEDHDDELILRPPRSLGSTEASTSFGGSNFAIGKKVSHLQAEQPYFPTRPASENDIFTISSTSNYNSISMTPEVPAISFTNLPKNYLETPTVEKYRESVSLYSIQTAVSSGKPDYSMPRYYRKSDLILNMPDRSNTRLDDSNFTSSATSISSVPVKQVEKSKRLKNIRNALPPLNLQLIRGNSSANLREKEAKEKLKKKDSIRL